MINRNRQSGMAALIIIFVVALVSVLVTGMVASHYVEVRRAANLQGQLQGREYALAAETYARVILRQDWENDRKENKLVDHEYNPEDEPWGQYAIQIPIDTNVGIQGQIDDLSGRFNINSLVVNQDDSSIVNRPAFERLERLLGSLDEINPDLTAEKFVDWIDADDQIYQLRGAEDETYLLKDPPYRAANTLFNDISELWLIDGMTVESYRELETLLAVLPNETNTINVNTAPAKVLMAYIPELTAEEADEVVATRREEKGFDTVQDFLAMDALAGKKLPGKDFTVNTQYFELIVKSVFNDRVTRMVSTIYRSNEGKTEILRRDYGKKREMTKKVYVPE